MMKYRKGSKVEVLNKRELPLSSWRCAEIISGNGHTYNVRYEDGGAGVERVPRKVIRPCPPLVEGLKSWVPGDIVEVFEEKSWKLAQVSTVVGGNYFFVRLLGSSREFRAHASNLRLRQTWQGDRWITIRKEPGKCDDGIINSQAKVGKHTHQIPQSFVEMKKCGTIDNGFEEVCRVSSINMKKRSQFVDHQIPQSFVEMKKCGTIDNGFEEDCRVSSINMKKRSQFVDHQIPQSFVEMKKCGTIDNGFEEDCRVSSINVKKRSQFCSPLVEACDGASRKMRKVEKEGRHQRLIAGHSSQLLKKITTDVIMVKEGSI